jgi:hypothetical protein
MTAPVSNIPLSIDYTSRDYYALREELIDLVKLRVNQDGANQWTGDNPSDFGLALIEAFAYVGDIVNFYIDRIANETYLPTATQRKNILNLASLYGYVPTGYRSALLNVRFSNDSEEPYLVPSGTQLTASVVCNDVVEDVIFTTREAATVPAATEGAAGQATVVASHGELISLRPENQVTVESGPNDVAGELLGTSDGTAGQEFLLSENQVVEGSVEIFVQQGDVYEPWSEVRHLADYGPSDAVFELKLTENNFVVVRFGDGISGIIPPNLSSIKANYIVGGGTIGNISTELIDTIYRIPGLTDTEAAAVNGFLTVTNTSVGIGGSEPEDNRSIRDNATRAITALNRAVSLEDYSSLALNVPNVGKANATAAVWSSVTLYVAPQRNVTDLDVYPGFDSLNTATTEEWLSVKAAVESYFSDKTMIGSHLTVAPPTYVPASIIVSYTSAAQYTDEQTEDEIKQTIVNNYSYSFLEFEQVLTPEEIERTLNGLLSVKNARIVALYRTGDAAVRSVLVGQPNEIFVFNEGNVIVSAADPDATLSGLVVTDGTDPYTLSPAFTPGFYSYNVLSVTTNTVDVTASVTASGGVLRINNVVVAPDEPATVPTPAGTVTFIPVTYTAPDGYTTLTYTLNVVRP